MKYANSHLDLILLILMIFSFSSAQTFSIKLDGESMDIEDGQVFACSNSLTSFEMAVSGVMSHESYSIQHYPEDATFAATLGELTASEPLVISAGNMSTSVISMEIYQILDSADNVICTFTLDHNVQVSGIRREALTRPDPFLQMTATEWIRQEYPELIQTRFGLELLKSSRPFSGKQYTHIFFDQYGNSLISTIPQGIAGRQYVVHVVYVYSVDNPLTACYLVNQISGEYLDALIFRGTSDISEFIPTSRGEFSWTETVTCLSTATSDIQIEIVRTSYQPWSDHSGENNVIVAKNNIRMSSIYVGSFEVGILNSTLSDPQYSLVLQQSDSVGVLNVSEDGDRGMVTVMATLYSSPVIWVQSLFGTEIPSYKLYGRNFLDDHEWYQRVFPSVGLAVGSSAIENLFLGLNFEFARGGNLFGGIHYGKVTTMNLPDGFIEGQTPMSEEEFNVLMEEKWDIGMAFGLTLDLGILTNLIGQ